MVYDVSKKETFNNIKKWLEDINLNAKDDSKILKVLIGNKKDSPNREVTEEEGKEYADNNNMAYFETSAKNNENVEQVFRFFANKVLRHRQNKIDFK